MRPLRPFLAALLAIAIVASPVVAQPTAAPRPSPPTAAPAPVATESFLEQRVIEELAADGIVLSRLGVVLDVELVEHTAIVSLVESKTSRAVASTKIEQLPTDRDIAVATVTPVVANLVSQIAIRPPSDDTATAEQLRAIEANQREMLERAAKDRAEDQRLAAADRAERARVADAEREYAEQAIGFDSATEVVIHGNVARVTDRWSAFRGETRVPLEGAAFYRAVGRPDLAARYRRNLILGGVTLGVGTLGFAAGLAIAARSDEPDDWKPGFLTAVGGLLVGGFGVYILARPHPVSAGEARRLGAEHNRTLREQLGLPVPTSTALRGARVAPYVDAGGGGLTLGGAF